MDQHFNQGMNALGYTPERAPLPPKSSRSKRKFVLIAVAVGLMLIGCGAYLLLKNTKSPAGSEQAAVATEQPDASKKRLRLIATGDMIPHDAINKEAKQADGSYEYSPMYGDMKTLFDSADVRFCNQAVLGGGTEFGITGYPSFNAPTEFSRDMNEVGCNLVNTGSNHTNDFNQAVISASVGAWDDMPNMLAVAGANRSQEEKDKVRYFEVKGVKFAFVSYTTYTNKPSPNGYSVTMYSQDLAKKQLSEARSKADIVIASMRWGTEYSGDVTGQQRTWAKQIADMGADVMIGHGPHVLEPVERFTTTDGRQAIAWYSLGNFLNAQLEPESLFNGIAVMDINLDAKKIEAEAYLPTYMHYEWSAAEKAKSDLLARHNFRMYTFSDGQEALNASQNDTTFDAQQARIKATLNKLTEIKLITKDEYLQS